MARERRYFSADTKAQLKRVGFGAAQQIVPALVIPWWSVTGTIAVHQLRADTPREVDGKVRKYELPYKARNVIDVHPRIRSMVDDPAIPLVITEGTKKTDAAVSRGLCCIGLNGVYGWRGQNDKGGTVALPDWHEIALNDRDVIVVFDSDVTTKPAVYRALVELRGFLEHRGADVRIVYLPHGKHGEKVGLDDFLVAGHDFSALCALATEELRAPPPPAEPVTDDAPDIDSGPGDILLDDIVTYLRRFVRFRNDHQPRAYALFLVHCHAIDAAETTPRIHFRSAAKRSGKTRAQEAGEPLVPNPLRTSNISAAGLYRSIARSRCTVFMDEVDGLFGPNARDHEDERVVLNSGFRRGAVVIRCLGDDKEPVELPTFATVCLAGIGRLPDTVEDRAITIELDRRAKNEPTVERFRLRDVRPDADELKARMAAWAKLHIDELTEARPTFPDELTDRACDSWEALLAIADLAGGSWPEWARDAARELSGDGATDDDSAGTKLLFDIATIFDDTHVDHFTSQELVDRLTKLEESPWAEYGRGDKPLTMNGAARLLKPFGVRPKQFRDDIDAKVRGYTRAHFDDAFARYLPSPGSEPVQPVQPTSEHVSEPVQRSSSVPDGKRPPTCDVPVVPVENPETAINGVTRDRGRCAQTPPGREWGVL